MKQRKEEEKHQREKSPKKRDKQKTQSTWHDVRSQYLDKYYPEKKFKEEYQRNPEKKLTEVMYCIFKKRKKKHPGIHKPNKMMTMNIVTYELVDEYKEIAAKYNRSPDISENSQ